MDRKILAVLASALCSRGRPYIIGQNLVSDGVVVDLLIKALKGNDEYQPKGT